MWGIIVALISGALMSVQGVFNTGVTKQTSTWLASAWVAFSGFVVAIACGRSLSGIRQGYSRLRRSITNICC